MSRKLPVLVTYDGPPVIIVDDTAWMPAAVRASALYDRRAMLEERAAVRDAAAEVARRPRSSLTSAMLMLAAIGPTAPRGLDPLADVDDFYAIQRTERLLRDRRIAAARAAEAPPVVRPPGEADEARAAQRQARKQRRAQAKRRGFR